MKKVTSVLIILALLMSLSVSALAADTAPTVTVGSTTAEVGGEVTLDVTISEATFASYGLTIVYDNTALELVSIVQGAASQGFFVPNAANGRVSGMNFMDSTVEGVLFTLTFNVLAAGEHTVSLDIDSFTMADQSNLEVTPVDGVISVEGGEEHVCQFQETERVEPTCTEDGSVTYTCECGETYTEVLPATGHSYTTVVTDPTCTEQGYTTYTCACGDSYVADYVDALGHNHVETERVEATCTENGSITYTCECGDTYTEVIEATGHDFVDGVCSVCGGEDPNVETSDINVMLVVLTAMMSVVAVVVVATKKSRA